MGSFRFVVMVISATPQFNNEPTVLCVIDFSTSAEKALRSAAQWAIKNNARITILHPYRLNQVVKMEDLGKVKRDIDEQAALNFKKLSHLLTNGNISYDFRSEVGFLTDRIQEHIRRSNIKMLVVNKDLAEANREAMNELTHQLEIPVIIVPQEKTSKK